MAAECSQFLPTWINETILQSSYTKSFEFLGSVKKTQKKSLEKTATQKKMAASIGEFISIIFICGRDVIKRYFKEAF